MLKYIEYLQLSKAFDRNILMVQQLESFFHKTEKSKSEKKAEKQAKPQDLAKMYETLIQNSLDLQSKFGEEDKTPLFRGQRCYYLSFVYIRQKKWNEALALLRRGESHLENAKVFFFDYLFARSSLNKN